MPRVWLLLDFFCNFRINFPFLFPLFVDINECDATEDVCTSIEECINTEGSYFCRCVTGYQSINDTCQGEFCQRQLFSVDTCADPRLFIRDQLFQNNMLSHLCLISMVYEINGTG